MDGNSFEWCLSLLSRPAPGSGTRNRPEEFVSGLRHGKLFGLLRNLQSYPWERPRISFRDDRGRQVAIRSDLRRTRAFVQTEWSEEAVLKLAGVGTEAEKEVGEGVGGGVDGRRRCEKGAK